MAIVLFAAFCWANNIQFSEYKRLMVSLSLILPKSDSLYSSNTHQQKTRTLHQSKDQGYQPLAVPKRATLGGSSPKRAMTKAPPLHLPNVDTDVTDVLAILLVVLV